MEKEKLIELALRSPFEEGESAYVERRHLPNSIRKDTQPIYIRIEKINAATATVMAQDSSPQEVELQYLIKDTSGIGANPFPKRTDRIRAINYTLESILFALGITKEQTPYIMDGVTVEEVDWNPFVYDNNGVKHHYQRDFVWDTHDKQLLVESIYMGVECGRILIRKRGFGELQKMRNNGETQLSFSDIIDGKQRLGAISDFINNKYPDLHGNYWRNLSENAQRKFTDHQYFSYSELPEDSADKDVLYQFLRLNFSGKPQSQEHLDYVKNLLKQL